jgi:hypothetical protein
MRTTNLIGGSASIKIESLGSHELDLKVFRCLINLLLLVLASGVSPVTSYETLAVFLGVLGWGDTKYKTSAVVDPIKILHGWTLHYSRSGLCRSNTPLLSAFPLSSKAFR